MENVKVLFVCLGNICRSPLAEAILENKAFEKGLRNAVTVRSCGTSNFHVNEAPDKRTIAIAKKYGIPMKHEGVQLKAKDFRTYEYIIAMDNENKENILKVAPSDANYQLHLMRDFDTTDKGGEVDDPWFGDMSDFEKCYETLDRCCDNFLNFLVDKHDLK